MNKKICSSPGREVLAALCSRSFLTGKGQILKNQMYLYLHSCPSKIILLQKRDAISHGVRGSDNRTKEICHLICKLLCKLTIGFTGRWTLSSISQSIWENSTYSYLEYRKFCMHPLNTQPEWSTGRRRGVNPKRLQKFKSLRIN